MFIKPKKLPKCFEEEKNKSGNFIEKSGERASLTLKKTLNEIHLFLSNFPAKQTSKNEHSQLNNSDQCK